MEEARTVYPSLNPARSRSWAISDRWPAVGALLFGMTILYFVR
jgi:hypothetical protein